MFLVQNRPSVPKRLVGAYFSAVETHVMRLYRAIALLSTLCIPLGAINYPSPPQEPTVAQPQLDTPAKGNASRKQRKAENVPQSQVRLKIHLGDKSILLAEAQIPATYSFTHKKGQLQYQQTIRVEDIRELLIENYRARKISSAKDGDVYEFEPANVRIELKDGQVFKLPYLFKDMRKLKARNADGAFSVFAFFADTYKPRTGWQERGGDSATGAGHLDFMVRRAHPAAFTRLEYFEPVEKAGASAESTDKDMPGMRK